MFATQRLQAVRLLTGAVAIVPPATGRREREGAALLWAAPTSGGAEPSGEP